MRELVIEVYGNVVGVNLFQQKINELITIDAKATISVLLDASEGVSVLERAVEVAKVKCVEAVSKTFEIVVDTQVVE